MMNDLSPFDTMSLVPIAGPARLYISAGRGFRLENSKISPICSPG